MGFREWKNKKKLMGKY